METILITGGTGLIGTALTRELVNRGYSVIILTRKEGKNQKAGVNISFASWNPEEGKIDISALQQADVIIHLAGANVADGRWTERRKTEIKESRIKSAATLVKALKENANKVRTIISASAIGWYGPDPKIPNPFPFEETALPDTAFLGETCRLWEESIEPVATPGKRLVKLRLGIVLSREGGAYKEFQKPLGFGAATIMGSGDQIVSWIHITDAVGIFLYALMNEKLQGVYNAVAPQPVPNKKLIKAMADAKGGMAVPVKVPEIALKLMLGEMSIEVLKSATVSSHKIEEAGYVFQFPSIESAALNLHKKTS